jgi:hypothetical protein
MPRKTRILHGEDEYLFVEAPGDEAGPSLLILARPGNARAVPEGRGATHQTEHGAWCPIARFDGETLLLAPDPPAGLETRLKEMLRRYVEQQRQRIAQAKNSVWYVVADGQAVHSLHPAQPAGLLIKLHRDEAAARAALAGLGGAGTVLPTGELREFLELRAEEGFAGALLDEREIVFFLLDETSRIQFVKVRAVEGDPRAGDGGTNIESELLDDRGLWQPYEGDGELETLFDPDQWDRLMKRTLGAIPFVGYGDGLTAFSFRKADEPLLVDDPDGENGERILPLFHDVAAAEAFRVREKLGKATLERVEDLRAIVCQATEAGALARLQPGDHRARGGALWCDEEGILLDSFSGLWRSRNGRTFEPVEE